MKFKLHPAAGKIIVKEDGFKYTGRIVIPEKAERRPTTGKVVAIGEGVGKWEDKIKDSVLNNYSESVFVPYYKEGDHLAYGLYAGTVLQIKGQPTFRVLNMDEILCSIESDQDVELEGVGMVNT